MSKETPERFARIEAMFHHALALDEAGRDAYLDIECDGDADLARRVRGLLDLDATDDPRPDLTPLDNLTAIGAYRVVRRIGRGGMGDVWLAERDDGQFCQRVAIKVVQSGLASGAILERFRAERQVLANLSHPNIARLLDGGEHDGGVPYFVMEYIEGKPIDEYCDENALTVNQRLTLFRKVCAAVQHAHGNLIVHRDIKPSNILVTPDGEPKLLDFGIAKVLPEASDNSVQTESGQRAMTPRYASPEQVAGRTITTSTDVYALGVVLYELLTRRSPYRTTTGSMAEMQRAVLETDPARPSTALREEFTDSGTAARSGGGHHWRQLVGDLDTIVLMALRKDVQRRYASVEQLSEDLRRHLDGLPVYARPDTWSYRARKFVGRHRVPVGATTVAFLAIVSGLVLSYSSYRDAEDARVLESSAKEEAIKDRQAADAARHDAERARDAADAAKDAADAARDDARREAAIALAVGDFLESLLTAPDPVRSDIDLPIVRDVRVVEVLDRAAEALRARTFEFPEVEARVVTILGRSYFNLGEFEKARDLQARAREILVPLVAADDPRLLAVELSRAGVLNALGMYKEAEALFREILSLAQGARGAYDEFTLDAQHGVAVTLLKQFELEAAEELFRKTLAGRSEVLGDDHRDTLVTAYSLTTTLMSQGRAAEAEPIALDTLERRREAFGDEHAVTLDSVDQLGAIYRRLRGRIRDSERYYREAYEKRAVVLGKEHPRTFISQSGWAQALMWTGQPAKALEVFESFLPVQRRILGEAHPTVLSNRIEMTNAMGALGRVADIEPILRDVLDIAYRDLDEDDHFRPHARATYALCLSHLGRAAEAEEHFMQAHDELVERFGSDHLRVRNVVRGIVAFYKRTKQLDKLAEWEARLSSR